MAVVTQLTEKVGNYQQKFDAVKAQMMKNSKLSSTYSEAEIDVMIKSSLIKEAEDKITFSLRGEMRRGRPAKMGMTEEEFERQWRSKMKKRLQEDGFLFTLTKEEIEINGKLVERKRQEAVEEVSKMTAEALKKIITSIN